MTASAWSPNPALVSQANAQGLIKQELQFAGDSQRTVVFTTFAYTVGTASLTVVKNGKVLSRNYDYVEADSTSIIFVDPLDAGDQILVLAFVGITGTGVTDAQLRADLIASTGANIVNVLADSTGVARSIGSKLKDLISVKDFGAIGNGIADDTAAFTKLAATGLPWLIPKGVYKLTSGITFTAGGICQGQLVAAAGFAGTLIQIVNATYGQKISIYGLDVYSTDVRPNPYTAAKTVGILVGPNATYSGNTPCPGVTLYNCKSTRFSIGLQVSTFNITVMSGVYAQNDHNILVYSYDAAFNQVNDVTLLDVQLDSPAAQPGKIPYALRVGTTGDGVYTASPGNGVNLRIHGCNFDGGFVYLDNIYGIDYQCNYHEQVSGYTATSAAVVLGSAGAGNLRNVYIGKCWFTNFDLAVDVISQVSNLTVDPNSYASIKYCAVRLGAAETQSFKYRTGAQLGSTNWGSGKSELVTNFSGGIAISQLTFTNIQHEGEWLNNGVQLTPSQTATTSWYPNGMTSDGWRNIASAYGRFRSGVAVATGISGNQVGSTFTFTTPSDALKFNGGDRVTTSAGGAAFIKSVNYLAGTAVLDSVYTGAITISNNAPSFLGINLYGAGTPNGAITAIPGSIYYNISGGAGATLYVKESGTGNTGWVAK